jgi:hypothetical protein
MNEFMNISSGVPVIDKLPYLERDTCLERYDADSFRYLVVIVPVYILAIHVAIVSRRVSYRLSYRLSHRASLHSAKMLRRNWLHYFKCNGGDDQFSYHRRTQQWAPSNNSYKYPQICRQISGLSKTKETQRKLLLTDGNSIICMGQHKKIVFIFSWNPILFALCIYKYKI